MKINNFVGLAPAISILLILTLQVVPLSAAENFGAQNKGLPAIVIDPGHGGRDSGAKGPAGALEKEVCLLLAENLKTALGPGYNVILTRNADYNVEPGKRTGVANHYRAELFISLHTGAGFQRSTSAICVYSHAPVENRPNPLEPRLGPPPGNELWKTIQNPFAGASQKAAEAMKNALEPVAGAMALQVRKAPIAVLQGAAMPAILIEIGQITNPKDETALTSPAYLKTMAQAIAAGVDSFRAAR